MNFRAEIHTRSKEYFEPYIDTLSQLTHLSNPRGQKEETRVSGARKNLMRGRSRDGQISEHSRVEALPARLTWHTLSPEEPARIDHCDDFARKPADRESPVACRRRELRPMHRTTITGT